MLDAPFGSNAVEGLHTVPGGPLLAGFVLVAFSAGGDAVRCLVFAAVGLGANVVNSEAFVVNRRLAAVSAAIVPGVFNGLAPLAAGFTASQSRHIVEII